MVLIASGYDDGTIAEVIAFCMCDEDLLFGGKLVYGDEDYEEGCSLEGILSKGLMDFAAEDGFSQVLVFHTDDLLELNGGGFWGGKLMRFWSGVDRFFGMSLQASSSWFWDSIGDCLCRDCFGLFWSMKQDVKRQGSRLYWTVMKGFIGWYNN
ncbi:unnamed protein product [Vicia faba]|uniref:Uncharacterized protein n=1 Tax=Vicia faba TaxID=3906 RepID=A0AAV0YU30_VICFA|nr:unnamed protein product [Vicia faba]